IPFGCAKKVPTRAGEGTRPYVAWKKSPPGRVRAPAPTWLGKSPRRFAKSARGWGTRRRYEDREGPRRESLGTFPKQLHLPRIRWHASAAAPGGSDNREHCQRFQCQPRHKNSLRIRTQVRRVDQKPFADRERKIIGHHAFKHFVVLKFQTHPSTLRAGTAGEGLARQRLGVAKFPDEIDALYIAQVNCDHIPGRIQKLEFALADVIGGRDIAVDRIPVHLSDHDFFVSRGHWAGARKRLPILDSRIFFEEKRLASMFFVAKS